MSAGAHASVHLLPVFILYSFHVSNDEQGELKPYVINGNGTNGYSRLTTKYQRQSSIYGHPRTSRRPMKSYLSGKAKSELGKGHYSEIHGALAKGNHVDIRRHEEKRRPAPKTGRANSRAS